MNIYVVLDDVTPNRGNIRRIERGETPPKSDRMAAVCLWTGDEEPVLGKRAYHSPLGSHELPHASMEAWS